MVNSEFFIESVEFYFIHSFVIPKIDLNEDNIKDLVKEDIAEALLFRKEKDGDLVTYYIYQRDQNIIDEKIEGFETVVEKNKAEMEQISDIREIDILDKFFMSKNFLVKGKHAKVRCKPIKIENIEIIRFRENYEYKPLSFLKSNEIIPYVFLYPYFGFALVLMRIKLNNCSVDDLINVSHLLYRDNLLLQINYEQKHISEISGVTLKKVLSKILENTRKLNKFKSFRFSRVLDSSNIDFGSIALKLIWIRRCKKREKVDGKVKDFKSVEEIYKYFPKELYGLATSDEDWRGIPTNTAKDRLNAIVVIEREEFMMILHSSGIVHITLHDPRKSARNIIHRYTGTIVGDWLDLPILPHLPLIEASCLGLTILKDIVAKVEEISRLHGLSLFQYLKMFKKIRSYWIEFLNLLQAYRELLEIPIVKTEQFSKFAMSIGLSNNEELAYSKLDRYAHQSYQIITTYLMLMLTFILLLLTAFIIILQPNVLQWVMRKFGIIIEYLREGGVLPLA
ncbi:MAG: hypothetical protein J7K36_11185 [Archaeoglobaceae archaeon]|nr:hypothetical protein [Archaeoglobaceae archaeon]